jgi:hypothetical protein
MIIGDPSRLAIESGITNAYERRSFLALGFFVLHIGDQRYGVYSPDATMLANSFDKVERRIADRGKHTASFASEPDAGKIADAVRFAVYAPDQEKESYFGIPQPEFSNFYTISTNRLWAPDGDEAFDDGSYVLQFDVNDQVRLIAFKSIPGGYRHDQHTLSDVWLSADEYYGILRRWHDAFLTEWEAAPKVPEL